MKGEVNQPNEIKNHLKQLIKMKHGKLILGTATAILTICSVFAFSSEKKYNGGQRLYTTSAANGCRLAQCWVAAGTGNLCGPGVTYYIQKTVFGRCKEVYTGPRTSTN